MPRYVSMKSMSIHHEIPEIYRVKRALTDVDHIANEFYEAVLDLDPVIATEQGRTGVATQFRDYSPAGEEAYIQLVRATLKKLDQVIPIDDVDLVTLDALQERLGLSLESHRAGLGGWQLNNIVSVPQEIRGGFDLMARNTEQDWANIAGRLFNVPQAITGFVQTLHTARVAGHVSPRRQIEIVIEQIAAYIAEDGFFDELAAEITQAVPDLAEQARRGAKAAKDGYATLKTYLHEVLLPAAPQQDAVGRKLYALHSRASLGASVDLDETYAWGVQELDRILTSLVTDFDAAEQPLREAATLEQLVVDAGGDEVRAKQEMKLKEKAFEERRDFMQLLTDAAMNPSEAHASVTTQKMALVVSRDWILSAYRDHIAENRAAVPNIIPFKIGAFEGETADGENEEELITRFAAWNDFERTQALSRLQLSTEHRLCQWGGIVTALLGLYFGGMTGFIIGALIGAYLYYCYHKAVRALDEQRAELEEQYAKQGTSGAEILRGILAEVVDYREEYESLDSGSQQTIDFLTALHPDQFRIDIDHDRRIRIQE